MSRNRRKLRDLTLTLVCRTTLPRHHHADVLPFPAQPRQHPAIEETSRSVTAPTGIYFRPPADDGPPRARAEGSRRRLGAAVGVARQRKSTFTTAPSAGPADYFSARADRRGGDSAARRRFTTVTQTLRGQLHGRTATGRARRRAIWSLPTGARACVCVCVCGGCSVGFQEKAPLCRARPRPRCAVYGRRGSRLRLAPARDVIIAGRGKP